ncbi:hypothetical protein J7384_18480 [Endozoicomonas sp. G2_1]|uniref:hypothetical protein n=1 Tax=Endozoicomonas sp. G2_1 TaxID=2821091 RepID=UPI001ADA4246|nr:hypothetical protein [Endozoicomonas sp. G2_1]MBO9492355.1 hypothetical protein [Endozoicomonas sp. G2_1]
MKNSKLLPNAKDVFSRDIEKHAELLFPLLSIDLQELYPELSGLVHFILPFEPFDHIGLETTKYHTYYSRVNWLAYKLENNKCSLEPDYRFFQKEYIQYHPEYKNEFSGVVDYLDQLPADLDRELLEFECNYIKIREKYFNDSNKLHEVLKRFKNSNEAFKYIDGRFPSMTEPTNNIDYPITENGRKFRYIGKLDPTDLSYYDKNNKLISLKADFDIIMYYDPVDKIILNTFFYS